LTLEQPFIQDMKGSRQAAMLELVAIPLNALPKLVLSVVAPPWDGPVRYGGAAIVDLRDPLPTDFDLKRTIAFLTDAIETTNHDAETRLKLSVPSRYTGINRVGVMRWDDNSLGCPGVVPSSHVPVNGYILFVVPVGTWPSRELEYHAAPGRTVFCGYTN
jgi:hypothetical protein